MLGLCWYIVLDLPKFVKRSDGPWLDRPSHLELSGGWLVSQTCFSVTFKFLDWLQLTPLHRQNEFFCWMTQQATPFWLIDHLIQKKRLHTNLYNPLWIGTPGYFLKQIFWVAASLWTYVTIIDLVGTKLPQWSGPRLCLIHLCQNIFFCAF